MTEASIEDKAKNWLAWDKNEKTRKVIEDLLQQNDIEGLQKRLGKRMEFGTAGLRAEMGAGFSKMNDLTIIQTTQGFAKYLQKMFPNDIKSRGVIIGYDARHNSTRFAHLAAAVFIQCGIKCLLYSNIVPTPFVPFGVKKYGTCAGIMVTASHNPKQDNGYKVYWDNGAQIIPPHDVGISNAIMENLVPWSDAVWDDNVAKNSPLSFDPYDEVMISYYKELKTYCLYSEMNSKTDLKFTYTPVHGVGLKFAEESFKTFGFSPFYAVPEQKTPDPEFPTVKYPNPEEGKGVLTLAVKTADENGCSVILANDPDADRLAIAEKQKDASWKIFTGNELGYMFGTNVLDKDGISALAAIGEAAVYLKSQNLTLTDQLENIYDKYGFHTSNNGYYISHDKSKTADMFRRLRNYTDGDNPIIDTMRGGKYPRKLGRFVIDHVRDLTTGFDSRQKDGTATLPTSSSSEMLTFYFANGVVLTLRTSGTEPKIKYYSEKAGKIGDNSKRDQDVRELQELIDEMSSEFYQPEKNGFLPKTT